MVPCSKVEVSILRKGRMMFTRYSHLRDGELVAAVLNSSKSSELEMELANRLGDAANDKAELTMKLAQWNPHVRTPRAGTKYVGDA